MNTIQEKTESFIFKLIRGNLPKEENDSEEIQPLSARMFYLLITMSGIAAIAYGFAFGVFTE